MLSSTGYEKTLARDWCSSGSKCVFSLCGPGLCPWDQRENRKSLKVCKCDSEDGFKAEGQAGLTVEPCCQA